jgi:hypothetical protein
VRLLYSMSIVLALVLLVSCRPHGARSGKCFDDIRSLVQGRTTREVAALLGKPDSRQPMPLLGERWIWWNYTYLDGKDYPPEERGRVVHLEIIFEPRVSRSGGSVVSASDLCAVDPMSVSYTIPSGHL